jgi:hypothetical protein
MVSSLGVRNNNHWDRHMTCMPFFWFQGSWRNNGKNKLHLLLVLLFRRRRSILLGVLSQSSTKKNQMAVSDFDFVW